MIRFKWFNFGGRKTTTATQDSAADNMEQLAAPANAEGKRVLIVDDDAVFVKATSMKLRSSGFQVRAARDASEAIEALRDDPADAILMDINFPPDVCNGGMGSWDGFQIMNWLRSLPTAKGARFIMVSFSDSPEYRTRAAKLGAMAYLPKPVQFAELFEAMNPTNGTPVNV